MSEVPGVIVQFDGVGVTRPGGVQALRDFTMAIGAGEVVALVGRSGAGKTTALKLVNRLIDPSTGVVRVEGRSTQDWDAIRLRRRIGYVFQDVGLFPHMTVAQNVGIAPRLEGWSAEQTSARTLALLELVGLPAARFADRLPHELSGGQRQRVGVARAFALDPPVVLMDEPFGALDSMTRADVRREFIQVQRTTSTTVLIVTHDLAEAFALATRIGVVEGGRLVALDTPTAIAQSDEPTVRELFAAASFIPPPVLPTPALPPPA